MITIQELPGRSGPRPRTRHTVVTLSNLQHGDRAVIVSIDADDPHTTARLAARGIVPGTTLGVLRAGDPVLIGIDNEHDFGSVLQNATHGHRTSVRPSLGMLACCHINDGADVA